MAKAVTYKERIEGCKAKLEKLNKKLERILKAEESNYEDNNPYYYSDYDKRSTLRDIEETEAKLAEYESKYTTRLEKENSRNVQIIIDFLQGWKEKAITEYTRDLKEAFKMKAEVRRLYPSYSTPKDSPEYLEYQEVNKEYNERVKSRYSYELCMNPWTKREEKHKVKVEDGIWEYIANYLQYRTLEEALDKLNKELDDEMNRKYDFIIERTNKIVGEITDVTNIRIAGNGELNGIIIGTRGQAKVTTIIANGPIRIAHFRVLVKEVK